MTFFMQLLVLLFICLSSASIMAEGSNKPIDIAAYPLYDAPDAKESGSYSGGYSAFDKCSAYAAPPLAASTKTKPPPPPIKKRSAYANEVPVFNRY
jgi:hypothetical protein